MNISEISSNMPNVLDKAKTMQKLVFDFTSKPVEPNTLPSVNRSFERLESPPIMVMKFSDSVTKEVLRQIPSETAIRIYKQIEQYLKYNNEKSSINLKI